MPKDFFEDEVEERDGVPVRPLNEVSIGKMVKQKEELSNQVTGAASEIDRLHKRQMALEKEKQELEELTRRQEEYETGKKDITEKLTRGIVLVEKEHGQASRMVELLAETRERFNESLNELESIDEEEWSDEDFQTELNRALVRVGIAKDMYKKALARIDSASWHKSAPDKKKSDVFAEADRELKIDMGFKFWLVAGLAASLPLMLVGVLLFGMWLYFTGMWRM